jgi:hypothetical protein
VRRLFTFEGVRYAALLAFVTVLAGGTAFAAVEQKPTSWDGIWWAMTTMTTVGYDFHRLEGVEPADLMLDPLRGGRGAFRPFLAGIATAVPQRNRRAGQATGHLRSLRA